MKEKRVIRMNVPERVLSVFAPEKAGTRFRSRAKKEMAEQRASGGLFGAEMRSNGGYGAHGASTTKNSMLGWYVPGGAAEDDIDLQGQTLRKRARDLYAGGGLARSGPATLRTNVVGVGIKPKPKVDCVTLNMTDEAASEWERTTLREFNLWAESRNCDAARQQTFYEMQALAFLSELQSGDVIALFGQKEAPGAFPYKLTLKLIEADRLSTPQTYGESESKELTDGRIIDGVEIDRDGAVRAYHIASRHPLAESDYAPVTWTKIDAFGEETGMPNALHVFEMERPEQRRGIPFISAMIEQMKQLDRYMASELAANIVAAMLAVFLKESKDGTTNPEFPIEEALDEDDKATDSDLNIELNPGMVVRLPTGIEPVIMNPVRSNAAFDSFVGKLITVIGASMEIPGEVLMKAYNKNYTASRAAIMDFWRKVKLMRAHFNAQFNQPVYEQWLAEAVATGRVQAPGFFEDQAVRKAWCGCLWMGTSAGHVDPDKEVKAAQKRVELGISTEEQEAAEYNGGDYDEIMRQRQKEIEMRRRLDEDEGGAQKTAQKKKGKGEDEDA